MGQIAIAEDNNSQTVDDPEMVRILLDVFVSPTKAFAAMRTKPRWFVPFLLCVATVFVSLALTNSILMQDLKKEMLADSSLSAEEKTRWSENIERQKTSHLSWSALGIGAGYAVLYQGARLLGLSIVIWLAVFLYPTAPDFKTILSICSLSFLVMVPEAIIKIPLILAKGTTHVYLGPAALLPPEWKYSPLFNLFERVDIFSIWMVFLLGMGISTVVGISRGKAFATIGFLWSIWLLLGMFFGHVIQIM